MKNDTKKVSQVQNVLENGSLVVSVILERRTFNKEGDDISYIAVLVHSKDNSLLTSIPSSNFTMIEKDYFNYILQKKSKLEIESILYIEKKQFTNDDGDLVVYFDYFISNEYFRKLKLDKKAVLYEDKCYLQTLTKKVI